MPSFVNTLCRCHSTVRGLMNSSRADLRVRVPVAGEPGDLRLLRRELVARLDRALAHGLRRWPASSRRARSANASAPMRREHLVRRAQLLARVDAPVLAPQPLAVEQLGAGEVDRDAAAGQPLDRLAVERSASSPSLSSARDRASMPERPVGAARLRALAQALERVGDVRSCRCGGRLDQLDQRPAEDAEVVVLAAAVCAPGRASS